MAIAQLAAWSSRFLVQTIAGLILVVCAACAAESDDLDDLVARVQFNYYAADARALTKDAEAIAKLHLGDTQTRLLQYQIAYAQWKLSEVLRPKDRSGARHAAENCIEATDKGIEGVPKRANIIRPDVMHAELYAIQAACVAIHGDALALVNWLRVNKAMDTARTLQPANPRVLLVDATLAIVRAKSQQEKEAAERVGVAAVAAFDAQPPLPTGTPDWGHAEALARLGDLQLRMGNRIAARNSIERALVLASDYVWARELLAKTTAAR